MKLLMLSKLMLTQMSLSTAHQVEMIIGIMFIHLLIRVRDLWHKDLNTGLVRFLLGE